MDENDRDRGQHETIRRGKFFDKFSFASNLAKIQ